MYFGQFVDAQQMKFGSKPGGRMGRKQTALDQARQEASESGLLPHEWLLKVARGEAIPHVQWNITYDRKGNELRRELVEIDVYADFSTRVDAAKAAAPYYAPKLSTQQVKVETPGSAAGVMLVPVMTNDNWSKVAERQQSELKRDVRT